MKGRKVNQWSGILLNECRQLHLIDFFSSPAAHSNQQIENLSFVDGGARQQFSLRIEEIKWAWRPAITPAVNQPTTFLLAQREKEKLVCGCCPCRRPEAVGAPLVCLLSPPPQASFINSFSVAVGEDKRRYPSFPSASFILFHCFCLCFLLLAEPLAVPPPITHQSKKRQSNEIKLNSAALPFNSIKSTKREVDLIGLLKEKLSCPMPHQPQRSSFLLSAHSEERKAKKRKSC